MVQWPRTGICGWYQNWAIVWFQGPASLHYTHWSPKKEGIRGGSAHPFVREGLAAAATGFLTVIDSSSLQFLWVSGLQKEHSRGAGSLSTVSVRYHLDLFHLGKTVIIPPTPPALRRGFLWIGWHCPGDNGYKNACQISPRRRIMWGGCWITARNRMDCRGCRCEECLTGISWCIRSRACNWIFSVAGRRSCSGPRILMELQGQEGGGGRGRLGWGGGDMHLNQGQWDGGRKNKQVSWLLAITEQGFL